MSRVAATGASSLAGGDLVSVKKFIPYNIDDSSAQV
jgi:hypothetical protein